MMYGWQQNFIENEEHTFWYNKGGEGQSIFGLMPPFVSLFAWAAFVLFLIYGA